MKKLIVFLGIVFPTYCFSQTHASFSAGLGGFKMEEMKKHQSEIQIQFPTNVKIIESFPSYWGYELSITGEVREWLRLGGMIGITSTGGRMHYADYSGEIECDQITIAKMVALQGEVLLNPYEGPPIFFTCKTGAIFGNYVLDVLIDVNNNQDTEHLKFVANNVFIEPGLKISQHIFSHLSATLYGGYNINVYKDELKLADNKDLFLLDNSGKVVRLDWTGFRVNLGISVAF